ncbi:MAG: aminodeoxychorismate lyase [Thiothrix sp.]
MMWVNGHVAECLALTDRGLLYGDGVWETLLVKAGQAQFLDWHLERLHHGLQVLKIALPDWDTLQQEIQRACQTRQQAVLKIIITRGAGQRGYSPRTDAPPTRIVQITPWAGYPPEYAQQGIRVTRCTTCLARQPLLAGFKHLNRLEQVLARAEVGDEYQEGLVSDTAGQVIEGTMSNLFLINAQGDVLTPDLSQCGIAGVMRRFVIQTLAEVGIQCHIQAVTDRDVEQAQALFMTNSLMGVLPVRECIGKNYKIPPLIRELQAVTNVIS